MSIVFSALGCRVTAASILALLTAGCSGSDRIPLADIGGPQRGDVLVGKVDARRDGRVLIGRVGEVAPEAVAYAPPLAPANGGSAGIDYLDTPNLASANAAPVQPVMSGQSQSQAAMVIPEGGVNIDGALGVADTSGDASGDAVAEGYGETLGVQPQIVTQGGAMAIAEGNTAQPVVDGIGFDAPTEIVTGPRGPAEPAAAGGLEPMPVAEEMPEEGGILPLSADNGNSGMGDGGPVSNAAVAEAPSRAPVAKDCSLYLDKRNCR
jgi:hypothetical protein